LAEKSEQLKVLIVAEHASARFGGEAILPLHYFRVLRSRGVDVHLIVHARTRRELEDYFPRDLDRMHFVPDTALHRILDKCGKPLPGRIANFSVGWISRLLSQWVARRMARKLIGQHGINIIHQPIPVSPKETSLLYDMGVPVVIGPMNGGMTYPPGFNTKQGRGGTLFTIVARRMSGVLNRLIPGKLRATVLLVANDRSRDALPAAIRDRAICLPENGVDLSLWTARPDQPPQGGPLRYVFSGRLVDWKAVDVLVEAFAQVRAQSPADLEIVGDGPMRSSLEAQVRQLGIESCVHFHGWQPQASCAALLKASDVFVLPSLYECGGAVVLEAMAAGLPVIATAWGGPTDYLDATCGVLVPPTSREQLVAGFRDAMLQLARSPDLRREMGRAGRQRVINDFDWERKVDRILQIYAGAANVR
jgi:glycosyltransferase involved in cell wall biosynthesis